MNTDLTFLFELINPAILGVCLLVGFTIKEAIPNIPNRFIPLAALIVGTVLAVLVNLGNPLTLQVILSGMISGLASTGAYELVRNMLNQKGGH